MKLLTRKTNCLILILLLGLFTLAGCRTPHILTTSVETHAVDTVKIVETVRDTVVRIKADSSMIRALIECDSTGKATLKQLLEYRAGERLKPPEIGIDENNVLTAKAEIDSLALYLQLRERFEQRYSKSETNATTETPVNVLTWSQGLWIRLGKILSGVVPLLIAAIILILKNPSWLLKKLLNK